jgi:phage terminase large subunit-like protein
MSNTARRFSIGFVKSLATRKRNELLAAISQLGEDDAHALYTDFEFWAHDAQLPPDPAVGRDWTTWVFMGGRGAGKTRAGAEWIARLVENAAEPLRIALVAESYGEARMTMIEGVSGLMTVCEGRGKPSYFPTLRELRWANGSIAQAFSSEDPEGLRGPQFHAAWSDELGKWQNGAHTWAMLQMGLRLGARPRQVVTTTPRAAAHLIEILADPATVTTQASSYANRANLAPAFFDHIVRRYEGTVLGRQELGGELIAEPEGALFRREPIEAARIAAPPLLARVVVAVDPPVSASEDADACGIVVCGRLGTEAYVLADRSVQGLSPMGWASRVVDAAREAEADRVVVEVNQGGDLVETLLREIDPALPVRKVHATRGKFLRAEPVAALYEQGRVHHVGLFAELEDQMVLFEGRDGAEDDRLDALVWALTDLLLRGEPSPRIRDLTRS